MKYLKDMGRKEALSVILSKQTLSDLLKNRIISGEIDFFMDDKLRCFEHGSTDYEIGIFNLNYMYVKDDWKFLEGVKKSVKSYGGSEKLEKLLAQCEKLYGTNLFSYMVNNLCDLYFNEEIKPIVDYVEKCDMAIYNKDVDCELLDDYLDIMIEDYGEDYYIEDGEVFKVATKIA